jgi:hypothetical protein
MKYLTALRIFLVSGLIMIIGNFVGYKVPPLQAVPGMHILLGIVCVGYVVTEYMPLKLPSIAWISLVAIIVSLPSFPGYAYIQQVTGKIQFLAICTPILAYAGISIGKDMDNFKKMGFRIIIVTLLALSGTFIGSAIIADVLLRWTGAI